MIEKFIDEKIGFYFDGGFYQMIKDANLDKDEIAKWGSIAYLFDVYISALPEVGAPIDKEEVLSFIEHVYTMFEVDFEVDGKLDIDSLGDVVSCYEIDLDTSKLAIDKFVRVIKKNGLNLSFLVSH